MIREIDFIVLASLNYVRRFARTRGYESLLQIRRYSDWPEESINTVLDELQQQEVRRRKVECQYLMSMMPIVANELNSIIQKVLSKEIEMPEIPSPEDVLFMLPVLEWPIELPSTTVEPLPLFTP